MDDPLRMYLVVRRGAVDDLSRAGALAGAAAVACVREPAFAAAVAAWRPRPGKVCLRARSAGQWEQVLEEPHTLAGDAVAALPPRRRSERGPLLERLQAMSTDLGAPPAEAPPVPGAVTYLLNPDAPMSSGKTLAQIAHAAVMAAGVSLLPGPLAWSQRARFAVLFGIGTLPGVAVVLAVQAAMYGSPLKSGYGDLDLLFSAGNVLPNLSRYPVWLV